MFFLIFPASPASAPQKCSEQVPGFTFSRANLGAIGALATLHGTDRTDS